MKKIISILLVAAALVSSVFAKPKSKAEKFVFDFSKDFYPGVGYVVLNSSVFRDAYFTKADVIKNEYVIEKVSCMAGIAPIYLTLKVALQTDGSLSYEYSDLYYKKDNSKTEMTPLIAVSMITSAFDKMLPEVFNDTAVYDGVRAKFFGEAGMLYAMTNGLTEIRAAKFAEIVNDCPINLPAKVTEVKINSNADYSEYKYCVVSYVALSTVKSLRFEYYTNNDDKAELAQGDEIKISGRIKNFHKSPIMDYMSFVVCDNE